MDTLATLAVFATVSAIAVPLVTNAFEGQRLGVETRNVERELQSARLSAVATNRPIRVRFNCPVTGAYRRVEVIGTVNVPHADDAEVARGGAVRISVSGGGQQPADASEQRRPDAEVVFERHVHGSGRRSNSGPNGTVHVPGATNPWPRLGATDATITVAKGSSTKSIKVNSLGKIRIQ